MRSNIKTMGSGSDSDSKGWVAVANAARRRIQGVGTGADEDMK